PDRLRYMVADGRNMGVNERTIDLSVLEQAAAALAAHEQPGVVITTDESGRCVAVTRQDGEGRILSTIWEASEHGGGGEAFGWYCAKDRRFYRAGEWGNAPC